MAIDPQTLIICNDKKAAILAMIDRINTDRQILLDRKTALNTAKNTLNDIINGVLTGDAAINGLAQVVAVMAL